MRSIKMKKGTERLPVDFQKETYIRVFKEIVHKFNNEQSLEGEIVFNNNEMKNLIGTEDRKILGEFMDNFHTLDTRKDCFEVLGEEWVIRGGMFSSKVTFKDGKPKQVGFMINGYWKDYFYSKMDIELWHSVKGKRKELEILVKEEKAESKILEVMTDYINHDVKGKYNQRLLSLLNGMRGTGLFIMKYDQFKKVLDIPESYEQGSIDRQILNKAKIELLKAGIKITKIEKIKKGRSIDKIRILFKEVGEVKPKKTKVDDPKVIVYKNGATKTGTIADLSEEQIQANKKILKEMIEKHKN